MFSHGKYDPKSYSYLIKKQEYSLKSMHLFEATIFLDSELFQNLLKNKVWNRILKNYE